MLRKYLLQSQHVKLYLWFHCGSHVKYHLSNQHGLQCSGGTAPPLIRDLNSSPMYEENLVGSITRFCNVRSKSCQVLMQTNLGYATIQARYLTDETSKEVLPDASILTLSQVSLKCQEFLCSKHHMYMRIFPNTLTKQE